MQWQGLVTLKRGATNCLNHCSEYSMDYGYGLSYRIMRGCYKLITSMKGEIHCTGFVACEALKVDGITIFFHNYRHGLLLLMH